MRRVIYRGNITIILICARFLCNLHVAGRSFRLQNMVARENLRCLTGQNRQINTAWISVRRILLEKAATWGQNKALLEQIQKCADELNTVVAPMHVSGTPYILAPLHTVSDIIAAMIGAKVTPGKASVVVSARADLYNQQSRDLGGLPLSYCSIHQENKILAGSLMSLITEVAAGQQNMIIFPDISPDYTEQIEGHMEAKLSCHLFGRIAKLHNGVGRLSAIISARVVFYHLEYDQTLRIHIHPPVEAKDVAETLPNIIEATLQKYPQDWLLWHSHSLYFINH
ncbi:Lauroyl/myristoyl acyltransferase [Citrobacter freundii]|nr:Lauroyl/myristoyl acyltransferase [Citrobacter freundii]